MSAALGNPSKFDCPRLHDISERDTLINATSFPQGAALGWVQQLGLQPATLVQPTQWNHAFIWTFYEEWQSLENPNLAVRTAKLEDETQNSFVETNNKTNLAVPTANMQGKDEIRLLQLTISSD